MEPSRKVQRTFPPADIRNEALSVPILDKAPPPPAPSQTESSIQTNSSITIEPIKSVNIDITKPKVTVNIIDFLFSTIFKLGTRKYHWIFVAKICSSSRRICQKIS